ncbi:hypothetical protein PHYBLDRAFT_79020 [Phycomyces blakesleeanus NRRL 1555(-)]|uniref:Uncharacterized protein n=1 Tax=Phycomyces blakesleeanus (strain ATCC 8743b / DSM 1359 / FGSC 10004 / NBRC 33097 / NRRL 1555) TaxID=763407 RepID=A0A162UQL1_PHYB8|nr:hypothetical protein PHYBLDRAFT_79020 [Phycomyces blakesleeanus NRRL 1555(-)]OAD77123.1 hypothetical protein PHYBLDRAFT_79020 [Phycomyces blakesleeanus NRRL 1555(-)]|eukprot:XP_018295163.1 hypothetical protein PHYBLDRAFT_79020 [Phycomyces blakesleeanus NRRL 1555(-)]
MTKDEARFATAKQKALLGTVGLCVGIAFGTANMFGYGQRTYMRLFSHCITGSAMSVAAWMSVRGLLVSRQSFPTMYKSGVPHNNRPLQHLRILNNTPGSISINRTPLPTFVHSRFA